MGPANRLSLFTKSKIVEDTTSSPKDLCKQYSISKATLYRIKNQKPQIMDYKGNLKVS